MLPKYYQSQNLHRRVLCIKSVWKAQLHKAKGGVIYGKKSKTMQQRKNCACVCFGDARFTAFSAKMPFDYRGDSYNYPRDCAVKMLLNYGGTAYENRGSRQTKIHFIFSEKNVWHKKVKAGRNVAFE